MAFEMKKLKAVRQKEEEEKKHEIGITAKDMAEWRVGEFATRSHSGRDFIGRVKKEGRGTNFLKSQFKKMARKKDKKGTQGKGGGTERISKPSTVGSDSARRSSAGFMGGKVDIGNVTGLGHGEGVDFSPGFL